MRKKVFASYMTLFVLLLAGCMQYKPLSSKDGKMGIVPDTYSETYLESNIEVGDVITAESGETIFDIGYVQSRKAKVRVGQNFKMTPTYPLNGDIYGASGTYTINHGVVAGGEYMLLLPVTGASDFFGEKIKSDDEWWVPIDKNGNIVMTAFHRPADPTTSHLVLETLGSYELEPPETHVEILGYTNQISDSCSVSFEHFDGVHARFRTKCDTSTSRAMNKIMKSGRVPRGAANIGDVKKVPIDKPTFKILGAKFRIIDVSRESVKLRLVEFLETYPFATAFGKWQLELDKI